LGHLVEEGHLLLLAGEPVVEGDVVVQARQVAEQLLGAIWVVPEVGRRGGGPQLFGARTFAVDVKDRP
jgi:hypothetical protein